MGVTEDRYRRAAQDVKQLERITYRKSEIERILDKVSTDNIEALLSEHAALEIRETNIEANLKAEFRAGSIAQVIYILRKKIKDDQVSITV